MSSSDIDRRKFLKASTAVTVGATVAGIDSSASAATRKEIDQWQGAIGHVFRLPGAELILENVRVTSHEHDMSRPSGLRTHSLSLLFELKSGQLEKSNEQLHLNGQALMLTRIVTPEDKSGIFYEAILN